MFSDFRPRGLKRLSFWREPLESPDDISSVEPRSFLGFAILKRDEVPTRDVDRWYVFESVLVKYPHAHNCVPVAGDFHVRVYGRDLTVKGVLYCQQNGLNKACAQVALRALLGALHPEDDLSYRQINDWASGDHAGFQPWRGLDVQQIQRVLREGGVGYYDIDYSGLDAKERSELPPYHKLLYAGIESGQGALLGFHLSGEGLASSMRHILPFFGHTFNQDTWAPHAEVAYFHVGENTRYLPSETWASSFIGHDDNFGSNFCVPRLYVSPDQVDYVVELLREGCQYSGAIAEAAATDYLYSIFPELTSNSLPWLRRLIDYVREQQVVLRAVCVTPQEYANHWITARDWDGNVEDEHLCKVFEKHLPSPLWMVEVSVPDLFPANLHKVGEILLDASKLPTGERDLGLFICARVPGSLLLKKGIAAGRPSFASFPCRLKSHTPLFERK